MKQIPLPSNDWLQFGLLKANPKAWFQLTEREVIGKFKL